MSFANYGGYVDEADLGPMGDRLAAGNEADIFSLPNHSGFVYKQYRSHERRADGFDALMQAPSHLYARGHASLLERVTWVVRTVRSNEHRDMAAGVILPQIPDDYFVDVDNESELCTWNYLYDPGALPGLVPNLPLAGRIRQVATIVELFLGFECIGLVLPDIKGENGAWKPGRLGDLILFDVDAARPDKAPDLRSAGWSVPDDLQLPGDHIDFGGMRYRVGLLSYRILAQDYAQQPPTPQGVEEQLSLCPAQVRRAVSKTLFMPRDVDALQHLHFALQEAASRPELSRSTLENGSRTRQPAAVGGRSQAGSSTGKTARAPHPNEDLSSALGTSGDTTRLWAAVVAAALCLLLPIALILAGVGSNDGAPPSPQATSGVSRADEPSSSPETPGSNTTAWRIEGVVGLNVRATPSLSGGILYVLDVDDIITSSGKTESDADGRLWQEVQLAGSKMGWASSRYLVEVEGASP